MSREITEGKKVSEVGAGLIEQIIPAEGLTLAVRERYQTISTGFSILKTEPSTRFLEFLALSYPTLADAFSGELVLKCCGRSRHQLFHNDGIVGEKTLETEAEVDLRQSVVGMPSCFGVGYLGSVHSPGERVVLTRERAGKSEPVVVMPRFPAGSSLKDVYASGVLSPATEQEIVETLIRRLFSMKRPVSPTNARQYCSAAGTLELIRDGRMREFEEEDPSFYKVAASVNRALESALNEPAMVDFLGREILGGRVGEQHGDARAFDNLHFVSRNDGRIEAFIRDPVRLSKRTDEGAKLMQEWFITHDDLQVGMLIGAPFADSTYRGFTRSVVTAYAASNQGNHAIFEHPLRTKLFGLGIAYGVSVGLHVQNYDRTDLSKQLDWVARSDSGQGAAELEAQLGERMKTMGQYWEALKFLANTNFGGWKEVM